MQSQRLLVFFPLRIRGSFIESNDILRGSLIGTPRAGTLTNVANPAEEHYRRSAIGEGHKVIYVDINSRAREGRSASESHNGMQHHGRGLVLQQGGAALRKDLCKTSGDIMDSEKGGGGQEGGGGVGFWEVSNVQKGKGRGGCWFIT